MKAVIPVLDDTREKSYYLQVYDYIKKAVLNGDIGEGEKLPSLRSLSKSTGLSITTIEQAYNQLTVEGYIYSKAQSGYYVDSVFTYLNRTVPEKEPVSSQELYSPEMQDPAEGHDFFFDPDCFDFNKWKKCMNKVMTESSSSLFFESDPQGEPVLRHEIARYLYMSRGVTCSPHQIIIGAGTQQITNHLATILRKMSIDHVALENPVYSPVRNTFRDRGFAITSVDVADNGLILERLPANIRTAAYVSPSNHMFTGAVMPVGRRYELLRWAEANDSYIIEDDYDSELRYFGRPIPALRSLSDGQRVIYLSSFSSTLFAAVKISYMVLPEKIADMFSEMVSDYSQTCSKLEQLTLARFMESGKYQTHLKKLRKLYSQKLDSAVSAFASGGSDFIDVKNSASGINMILNVRAGKKTSQLKKEAESLGIHVSPVNDDGLLVFYYNQIPLAKIPETLKELIELWRSPFCS